MTDKTTAAFPCPMSEQTHLNQDCAPFQHGMSLRDYFAAKALESGEAGQWRDNQYKPQDGKTIIENIALHAYQIADAMLRAREQQ